MTAPPPAPALTGITRHAVLADVIYTIAVREKQGYKTSGWEKKKKSLLGSLAAMQTLCQYMARPALDDDVCDAVCATVPRLCPLLEKEPEYAGGFAPKFRRAFLAADRVNTPTEAEGKLLTLAGQILTACILLLSGKRADDDVTKETVGRYLMGLHNVVRPLLPADDRFRVDPETGWEYAREYLEPDFTLVLPETAAEDATAETTDK